MCKPLPQGPDLGLRSGRSPIGHIPESPGLVLDWSGRRRDSSPLHWSRGTLQLSLGGGRGSTSLYGGAVIGHGSIWLEMGIVIEQGIILLDLGIVIGRGSILLDMGMVVDHGSMELDM